MDKREISLYSKGSLRGKSLEERTACLGPAVFGDIGIPVEPIFRLTDEVKALRDALNAKLAGRGR
jgi:hypothetical protein